MTVRPGFWLGESGGGLEIVSIDGDRFEGRYRSRVGNVSGDTWFPASGITDGHMIGFSVLWRNGDQNAKSLTSWTGRHLGQGEAGPGDDDRERLALVWHLHRLSKNEDPEVPTEFWESTLTNLSVVYWTPQA